LCCGVCLRASQAGQACLDIGQARLQQAQTFLQCAACFRVRGRAAAQCGNALGTFLGIAEQVHIAILALPALAGHLHHPLMTDQPLQLMQQLFAILEGMQTLAAREQFIDCLRAA